MRVREREEKDQELVKKIKEKEEEEQKAWDKKLEKRQKKIEMEEKARIEKIELSRRIGKNWHLLNLCRKVMEKEGLQWKKSAERQ